MPSAINAKICEGEQTFEDFLYTAVRAMVPFIHMRDEPFTAKLRLPDPGFHTSGQEERIAEREAHLRNDERRLRTLQERSTASIKTSFEAHKKKALASYQEAHDRIKPVADRINRLRAQVADWQPPTPGHEDLKRFMIEQLDQALRWEANMPEKPVFEATAEEWHAAEIAYQESYIERSKELLQEERNQPDNEKFSIDWINALIKSVPPPPGRFE